MLLVPLELLINKYYYHDALKILKDVKPYIICITGSCGKTTVKNILYEIYKDKYLTLATPKSYNTLNGIIKTIRYDLKKGTKLFIVEAGATKIGDIKRITKLLKPNLGIITNITYQHMDTFKTINQVLNAKWELVQEMSYSSSVILNNSCPYLKDLEAYNLHQTIHVGKEIYAANLQGDTFDICTNNTKIRVKTLLHGLHNVTNITMCYAAVNALNEYGIKLTTDEFIKSVSVIKNPPHRLSFSKIQNIPYIINIIDDAYNANVEGFINAVAYLKTFSTMKTIITPGFVDSSKYLKLMYSKVISYLDGIDNIYLIYHKEIKVFEDLLKELKINYHIFKSFKEAYTQALLIQNDHTILLENDLPDNYLRRG